MGLVGVIDPSHKERKKEEPGRYPKWLGREELLETAYRAEPTWSSWPYELLYAALGEWQDRDYISTTMLTGGCARSKVLERREDFVLDVDSMYASLRGTLIHRTMEYAARPDAAAEARFFTTLNVPKAGEVEVSCSPDILYPGSLGDYKMTENPPQYYPWKSHTAQVNINAYIVRRAKRWELPEGQELPFDPRNMSIRSLFLVYLGPKGPKVIECTKAQDYTKANGETGRKALPYVWSDDETYDYLMPRLEGMVKALAAYPDWPEGLEDYPGFEGPAGWQCPGKPLCFLPDCLAKRYPNGLIWPKEGTGD